MIFLKSWVEHRTVRMCSHYTSGIDSYEALQKRSFKKPWYCLNVQSHVSYFANIMCRICLFWKLHPLHSCPCPPNSLSSFFLLCFILFPLPPSHFWWVFNCNFFTAGDSVQLLLHHDEFGDCFFLLLLHQYCIVCVWAAWYSSFRTRSVQYRLHHWLVYHYCTVLCAYIIPVHGTVVSVHPVYSTRVLFLPSVRHYIIIRMY